MKTPRIMLTAGFASACLALAAQAAAADPPRPDPKQPVNYVRWINEEFGRGITENAADRYQRAISAFSKDDDLAQLGTQSDATQWTPEQRRQLKAWVQKNTTCLEHFATAAKIRKCYFPLESDSGVLAEVPLPELSPMRAIGKLMLTRARLHLLEGNTDGAIDDIHAVLSAGRHLQSQPCLIQSLVGVALSYLAYDAVLDIPKLASQPPDYEKMLSKLRLLDWEPEGPLGHLEAERLFAFDVAQRLARDTNGDGRFMIELPKEAAETGGPRGKNPLPPPVTFETMIKQIDDYFDQSRSELAADLLRARSSLQSTEKRLAANPILGLVTPSFSTPVVMHLRTIATRNAASVVLELHAYRAKNGKWPADLQEGLMKSIARPRLDPFSGKPFGYRLKGGQPLLYSVGENGVDDHGEKSLKDGKPVWGDTGDYVFWPR